MMMLRNISDYQNCGEAISPDDLPSPPTARNNVEQPVDRPVTIPTSQRNALPTSLPTSPVHMPASTPANLSSPTDSYDSGALGKVRILFVVLITRLEIISTHSFSCHIPGELGLDVCLLGTVPSSVLKNLWGLAHKSLG